ncbi:MAG: AGE family epimerase/isomerase [Planctomycetes bacterium]|nr:AGE family epimerase/isomerase [Planctomycetota bacterium]
MKYTPFVIDDSRPETIASPKYLEFVAKTVFEAGLLLLLERHRSRPDHPYPDTKFNPNTGRDLPHSSYGVRYSWFLGRGAEACAAHLEILDDLPGLAEERSEVSALLKSFVTAQTDTILEVMEKNKGRCPFRLDSSLKAVEADGRPAEVDTSGKGAGDLFCAKGLIASGTAEKIARGKAVFNEYVECVLDNAYLSDQGPGDPGRISQGAVMLAFGTIPLLVKHSAGGELDGWAELAAKLADYVLDRHYDEAEGRFYEYAAPDGTRSDNYLDPGHATELVGLGLQAVEAIRTSGIRPGAKAEEAFRRVENTCPQILISAFDLGHNAAMGGIYKAVDNATGKPINDDLPWWNLPETMRAAARCAAVTADEATRDRCLKTAATCSNDYFTHYPNPENMLFPFQTRSGKTGEVIDIAPAVPEGDPLYHTNLALIDMTAVLKTHGSGA